jgi:hypothetical protein
LTISAAVTAIFLVFLLYEWFFNADNLYGTSFESSIPSVVYFAVTYIVALAIYLVALFYRRQQGIDLNRIHHEIPVE